MTPYQSTTSVLSSSSSPSDEVVADTTTTSDGNGSYKSYEPVHIYPYSYKIEDLMATGNYSTMKRFHFVRHAEGTHNVNKEYKDVKNRDARLTQKGRDQCHFLARQILQQQAGTESSTPYSSLLQNTDLVVTSPLTRCMDTAMLCFPTLVGEEEGKKPIPFVAHESIRETVNYECDRRRSISAIEQHYKDRICFDNIQHDHDEIWESYVRRVGSTTEWSRGRESAELYVVADRARQFWNWISSSPARGENNNNNNNPRGGEEEIIVCTHSAFLRAFLNWGQTGGVPQLMEQNLDQRKRREEEEEIPVVQYCGDENFETFMRSDYANCELRSFIGAFPRIK